MPALDRYIILDYFLVRRDGKNCATPSLHRDSLLAPLARGNWIVTGCLRRVTFTPSTAGPLGFRRGYATQSKIKICYLCKKVHNDSFRLKT